jgi:hypothetical protein
MEPSDAIHCFRHSLYECLHHRADALFELTDAILSADAAVPSPVHLSLQPAHRGGWGSYYYHPSRHSAGQPIVAGWAYQLIAQLSFVRESWTAPLDVERLRPAMDANEVAAKQVKVLLGRRSCCVYARSARNPLRETRNWG